MRAPTVYDVAERSGVSIATVSRVYRNPDSVRAETRVRVLEAARELGYVPSGNARGLANRTTGVLGICFPDFSDPDAEAEGGAEVDSDADDDAVMLYSDQVIRGMERAARRHGYALLIASSLEDGHESLVAKVAGRVDGFAVLAGTVPTEDLDVISRRLPVVMLAGPRGMDRLDHIEVDNADGQRELTRHLIEDHGLRRLAFIGTVEGAPDAEARFRGYTEACRAAGLPVREEPDVRAAPMTRAEGVRAADELLDRGAPEAMIFANDQMAVGALHALERRGVRVPQDVAVTGFDGIPLGRLVRPALTTVRQPMRRLGEEAVKLLVQRLGDRDSAEASGRRPLGPQSLILPVKVARRASCGC